MAGTTIGWREWVALPDLGVTATKAKIDTGARSSSLHAWDVEVVDGGAGGPARVRFVLHPRQRDLRHTVAAEADLVEMRAVRSSNGEVELRPVVRTPVVVAGRRYAIELTLTRRDAMGFRMLLGRRALRRRFVVDPGRSFVAGGSTVAPSPPLARVAPRAALPADTRR
ncbi:MAG TPA: RimK/LysX family protein [Acidimicrobiales bacterium]|nr:RimK/LysX family protein [Acidimicrobiales bacterium]